MKPLGMRQEIYERYQSDGFSEPEIEGIWRSNHKGKPKEDIRKAVWYLNRLEGTE